MSLKPDNYIKDRKNVTIFLGEEIKMALSISPAYRLSQAPAPAPPPALPQAIIKLIDNCKSTQRLNLSNHNLNNSDVEEILKYVTERKITVKTLDLGKNQLTRLPESIGQLKSLEFLHLNNNQLAALPESIGQLAFLRYLYLDNNQLATLPESIEQLKSLQNLNLEGNIAVAKLLIESGADVNPDVN